MGNSALEAFARQIREHRDTDECAAAIRRETGWWMGAFTAVFSRNLSKVLMVQLGEYARDADGRYPWTLPGGSVEPDELPTVAAARELFEETGMKLAEELTTAAWLSRPYYQSPRSAVRGEFIVLFAARSDAMALRAKKPSSEIRAVNYWPFDSQRKTVTHAGDQADAWFPSHWMHWAACAHGRLSGTVPNALVHHYEHADAMNLQIPEPRDAGRSNRAPDDSPLRP